MLNSAGLLVVLITGWLYHTTDGQTVDSLTAAFDKCAGATTPGSYVCDPSAVLSAETTKRLRSTLVDVAANARCQCENQQRDCQRAGLPARFNVALVAVADFPANYQDVLQRLFNRSPLNAGSCKNGMLIAYSKNARKVHTVTGTASFGLLTTGEIGKIEKATETDLAKGNDSAVNDLLSKYSIELAQYEETVQPYQAYVGIIVASAIGLLALALIFGLCCTLLCPTKQGPTAYMTAHKQAQRSQAKQQALPAKQAPLSIGYGEPQQNGQAVVPYQQQQSLPPPNAPSEPIYIVTEPPSEYEGGQRGAPPAPADYPPMMMMPPPQPPPVEPRSGAPLSPDDFMDPMRSVEYQKKQTFIY